jgi:choline dehydrogenase-like flavoprotein
LTCKGSWNRGDAKDYEDWASLVGDTRWSWEGFLPYFRKIEHHHDPNVDLNIHGRNGPLHTSSVSSSERKYPLRDLVKAAWESLGVKQIPDVNCGDQIGMAEEVENRIDSKRIVAAAAYPLDGVTVMTGTLVRCVLISSEKIATGVELADGRRFATKREVIVSTGSIRTPQLLMLSGVGPADELRRHNIEQVIELPDVGRNLWDHLVPVQRWKLRNPEIGAAIGSSKWTDPRFKKGNPMDWWTNHSVPEEELKKALSDDNPSTIVKDDHPLLRSPRSHLAFLVHYFGAMDGTQITTMALHQLPTTRGSITLASANPADSPLIDHKHLDTGADRYRLRFAVRLVHKLMSTLAGQEMVVEEAAPEGFQPVTAESTDEEIDARVRQCTV